MTKQQKQRKQQDEEGKGKKASRQAKKTSFRVQRWARDACGASQQRLADTSKLLKENTFERGCDFGSPFFVLHRYEQFDEAMAISRNNIPILQKLIYQTV
jgi:hypothetical protein